MDPDRLAEEKRRGLTIDLGFAWLTTPAGRQVGIVDVPGHERFIKNMLAGVGAINLILFTVAANEGWKPQSQEHLDIINLLGICAGIVVVTKVDTVDAATLDDVRSSVESRLKQTTLQDAPVIEVSAITGEGLGRLKAEIDLLLQRAPAPADHGRPRLWIDRVFTIKGSGTVVTGTLGGGTLTTDQLIDVLPGGTRARIRTIQSHQRQVASLGPGNRAALNLVGADQRSLSRGHTLGAAGSWKTSDRFLATVQFLPHLDHEPRERGAYKLHVGSVEIDASLRFLQKPAALGQAGIAAIRLARPTVLDYSDRFIVRDSGRNQTIGGGSVLEAEPARLSGDRAVVAARSRMKAQNRAEYLEALLEEAGYLPVDQIFVRTGIPVEQAGRPPALRLPGFVVSPGYFDRIRRQILSHVRTYQASHPLDAGLPMTSLRSALRLPRPFLDELVAQLASRNEAVADGVVIRTPDFSPKIQAPQKLRIMSELREAGASPPSVAELAARHGADLVKALVRSGDLVQVSPDLTYPAEWMDAVRESVRAQVASEGAFTVARFRDMVGTTRKYAVPVLEYLDRSGFTCRKGDLRILGPKA